MKKAILAALILIITTSVFSQQKQDNSPANPAAGKTGNQVKHHVVMQLTTNDTTVWKGLMLNIKHLRDSWGETVQIEVVSYGSGLDLLLLSKSNQMEKIKDFTKLGVSFVACENTMRLRKISKDEVTPDAGYVPSGVGELVLKQEAGWSYIKSGF